MSGLESRPITQASGYASIRRRVVSPVPIPSSSTRSGGKELAMARTPTTIIDLARLSLAHGEGARLDLPVRLGPLELGGQTYVPRGETLEARIDLSRPSSGYAFRLRFPLQITGPCMRCLEDAAVETEVDAREVDQSDTDDEELRSPYVEEDELDLGRWS